MESSNANGVPVVVFTQPIATGSSARPHPYATGRRDLAKQLTTLGSLQIVFGCLLIIFQIVCVILASTFYHHGGFAFVGYGIWMGIFFVITGAFGCAAGRRNNRGFMVTFNVMSIISASMNTLLVILAAFSIVLIDFFAGYLYNRHYGESGYYDSAEYQTLKIVQKSSMALEGLMIIVAVAEAIVAIWSSVVCCKMGGCCCDCGDACCCPPVPAPTQVFWAQHPPVDGAQHQQQQQQQPMLVYAAVSPNSPPNDGFQDNKHQKSFQYQQLMSDPNPIADIEIGDQTRLCA